MLKQQKSKGKQEECHKEHSERMEENARSTGKQQDARATMTERVKDNTCMDNAADAIVIVQICELSRR